MSQKRFLPGDHNYHYYKVIVNHKGDLMVMQSRHYGGNLAATLMSVIFPLQQPSLEHLNTLTKADTLSTCMHIGESLQQTLDI